MPTEWTSAELAASERLMAAQEEHQAAHLATQRACEAQRRAPDGAPGAHARSERLQAQEREFWAGAAVGEQAATFRQAEAEAEAELEL